MHEASACIHDAGMRKAAAKQGVQPRASPAGKRGPVADRRAQRYSDHEDSVYSESSLPLSPCGRVKATGAGGIAV